MLHTRYSRQLAPPALAAPPRSLIGSVRERLTQRVFEVHVIFHVTVHNCSMQVEHVAICPVMHNMIWRMTLPSLPSGRPTTLTRVTGVPHRLAVGE